MTIINAEAPIALFVDFDSAKPDKATVSPLTPCCCATGKGCDGYVGCRKCYAEVSPLFGDIWLTDGSDPLLAHGFKYARKDYDGWASTYKPLLMEQMCMDNLLETGKSGAWSDHEERADHIVTEAKRQIAVLTGRTVE